MEAKTSGYQAKCHEKCIIFITIIIILIVVFVVVVVFIIIILFIFDRTSLGADGIHIRLSTHLSVVSGSVGRALLLLLMTQYMYFVGWRKVEFHPEVISL